MTLVLGVSQFDPSVLSASHVTFYKKSCEYGTGDDAIDNCCKLGIQNLEHVGVIFILFTLQFLFGKAETQSLEVIMVVFPFLLDLKCLSQPSP